MTELAKSIQAVLFAAPDPLSSKVLSEVTGSSIENVTEALREISDQLEPTGIRLSSHNDAYRLVTAPEATTILAAYHKSTLKTDLSRPALETLAIIAYQGPITRSKIEEIRGVGSDQMIRNLLTRELIEESGRSNESGRPVQYGVTEVFLDTVGITKLSELPPLTEAS